MKARVCIPCRIQKIHGNQHVDLQPLFKVLYVGKTLATDMPIIQNCPVNMPSVIVTGKQIGRAHV